MNLNTLISDGLFEFLLLYPGRNLHTGSTGTSSEMELGNELSEPETHKRERLTSAVLSLHSHPLTPDWGFSSKEA